MWLPINPVNRQILSDDDLALGTTGQTTDNEGQTSSSGHCFSVISVFKVQITFKLFCINRFRRPTYARFLYLFQLWQLSVFHLRNGGSQRFFPIDFHCKKIARWAPVAVVILNWLCDVFLLAIKTKLSTLPTHGRAVGGVLGPNHFRLS